MSKRISDSAPFGAGWLTAVCDHMWKILGDHYRTGLRSTAAMTSVWTGKRSFWPAYAFDSVSCCVVDGADQLRILFRDRDHLEVVLGYRINLAEAARRWSQQVGDRDPRRQPEMFATELVWFMVCHIGVAKFTPTAGTKELPQWINEGNEIFGRLPNNPNMDTFQNVL
jgi:hypothetical protein